MLGRQAYKHGRMQGLKGLHVVNRQGSKRQGHLLALAYRLTSFGVDLDA